MQSLIPRGPLVSPTNSNRMARIVHNTTTCRLHIAEVQGTNFESTPWLRNCRRWKHCPDGVKWHHTAGRLVLSSRCSQTEQTSCTVSHRHLRRSKGLSRFKYLPLTLSMLPHIYSDPCLSLRSRECLSSSAIPFALSFSGLRTSALGRPEARKS